MGLKFVFVIAHVLLVKLAASQCINTMNDFATPYVSYQNCGYDLLPPVSTLANDYIYTQPYTGSDVIYSNLDTVSTSPISPGVITVSGDNLVIGGQLSVSGSMPLYGAVTVNGNVPTNGQASVVYSAGNGINLSSTGYGIGPQVVTNSGPIFTNPPTVVSSSPVFGNQIVGSGQGFGSSQVVNSPVVSTSPVYGSTLVSSGPVYGSNQVVTSGPVGSQIQRGCGCY